MESKIIRAEEVAKELDVSVPYAYKIIRKLNDELKAKGYITVAGRVNRKSYLTSMNSNAQGSPMLGKT